MGGEPMARASKPCEKACVVGTLVAAMAAATPAACLQNRIMRRIL